MLALEREPKNECGITNYFINLYKNSHDLQLDKQEENLSKRINSLSSGIWIQDCDGKVYHLQPTGCDSVPTHKNADESILDVLEKVVTNGTNEYKKIFETASNSIESFLERYR